MNDSYELMKLLKQEAMYQGSVCNHRMSGLLEQAAKEIERRIIFPVLGSQGLDRADWARAGPVRHWIRD